MGKRMNSMSQSNVNCNGGSNVAILSVPALPNLNSTKNPMQSNVNQQSKSVPIKEQKVVIKQCPSPPVLGAHQNRKRCLRNDNMQNNNNNMNRMNCHSQMPPQKKRKMNHSD